MLYFVVLFLYYIVVSMNELNIFSIYACLIVIVAMSRICRLRYCGMTMLVTFRTNRGKSDVCWQMQVYLENKLK